MVLTVIVTTVIISAIELTVSLLMMRLITRVMLIAPTTAEHSGWS